MEPPILKDPDQYPTEQVIASCLGKTLPLWDSFFEHIHEHHPDFSQEWRYYKDGHSWLLKVTRKSKTVFWTSIIEGLFRITFYFTDKVEGAISDAEISDELKDQFKNGKHYGKLRGLTITFRDPKDIEYAKALIATRLAK
jgi:hypothetical protein